MVPEGGAAVVGGLEEATRACVAEISKICSVYSGESVAVRSLTDTYGDT